MVGVETESSRDLKSWAKSRASQNRSDQSILQCTANNTISTFDLFQSLHNVKMVLGACIELLQDASTLMQEGKLCRYVYTERILQICIQRVLGELGPGQLGPGQLGPGQLGPWTVGPPDSCAPDSIFPKY